MVRDICALDKFLLRSASQAEDLKAQMARIMRIDLNAGHTVGAMAFELGKASGISRSITDCLDKAKQQLDKIDQLDKIGGGK